MPRIDVSAKPFRPLPAQVSMIFHVVGLDVRIRMRGGYYRLLLWNFPALFYHKPAQVAAKYEIGEPTLVSFLSNVFANVQEMFFIPLQHK
jgi:hypothetical protein